jgi:hypothetical protein
VGRLGRLACASVLLTMCAPPAARRGIVASDPDAGTGGAGGGEDAGGVGGGGGIVGAGGTGATGGSDAALDTRGMGGTGGTGGSPRDSGVDARRDSAPPDTAPVLPAPGGLAAMPGDGSVRLSWSAVAGASGYKLERGAAAGGPFTTVAPTQTATTYLDKGLTNGTAYFYAVSATSVAGEGPRSAPISATPVSPWTDQDIGAVSAPGSSSQSGGTFTVSGTGADIYDNADAFHYVFQNVTGDATIIAHVASIQNVDVWTKAAVMMRDGLGAGAVNVVVLTSPTAANDYRLQARLVTDAATTSDKGAAGTAPIWLRLVRRANTINGSTSPDGRNWTAIGTSKTIPATTALTVGLAVVSHAAGPASATFDNVSLTTP